MNAKHTPTPWIALGPSVVVESNNEHVADCSTRVRNMAVSERAANARHICLCVNRLVEALKDASSLGEIVASVKYYDEKENVLLTREQLRRIEHVFCVANKALSEIEKGGAE